MGPAFRSFAADDEPIKIESDERSPAGFYAIGRPFGFAPSPLAGYLQLQSDSICVENPSSPAYKRLRRKMLLACRLARKTWER